MSSPIIPPQENQQTQPVFAPTSTDPATAGAVASANKPGQFDTSAKVSSIEDLKKQNPELYQKMMEGIATTIIRGMKKRQDNLKRIMREGRRSAEA